MVYLLRFCNGIWIRKYDQKSFLRFGGCDREYYGLSMNDYVCYFTQRDDGSRMKRDDLSLFTFS